MIVGCLTAWCCVALARSGALRRTMAVLAGILTIGVLIGACVGGTPDDYPMGDAAFTELYCLYSVRGIWPFGPYSQFGFHHPGPLFYYAVAPFYATLGHRMIVVNATAVFINVAALATLFLVVMRRGGRTLAVCSLMLLTAYVVPIDDMFRSAWNPHVIVLPVAAFMTATAAVGSGAWGFLPIALLFGSFAAQTLVGVGPAVATLLACAIGWRCALAYGGTEGEWASAKRALNVNAWVLLALWLLPIAEQLVDTPGNVTLLFRYFAEHHPHAVVSDAIAVWANMTTALVRHDLSVPVGAAASVTVSPVTLCLAVTQFVLLAGAGWWTRRWRQPYLTYLCTQGACASAVALWSVSRISGLIGEYAVFWISIIGAVNWAALLAVAVRLCARRFDIRVERMPPRLFYAVSGAMVIFFGAHSLVRLRDAAFRSASSGVELHSAEQAIAEDMRAHGVHRGLLRASPTAWAEQGGVAFLLYKDEVPIGIDRNAIYMFGPPLVTDGTEDEVYTVALRRDIDEGKQDTHGRVVVELPELIVLARASCAAPCVAPM